MTEEKMWPIATTLILLAMFGAIAFTADGCAKRSQEFRLECVKNGGTLFQHNTGDTCIHGRVEERRT